MAESPIWSKLPEHLIPYIIEQTQDIKTLKNWCEATKGTWHLNRVATRLRWGTFTINRRNMHMGDSFNPTELADAGLFTPKRIEDRAVNNEVSQALRETDGRPGYGVIPATLIKRLLVNLQTGWGRDYMKDTIAKACVVETLDVLLPHASSLEEIEHFGLLCQALLDIYVKFPTVSRIKLRETHSCTEGLYDNPETTLSEDINEDINLARLSCISNLTFLDVSQLRSFEAPGLAKAVRSFTQLHHLRVSEMADNIDHSRESQPSPLALFLRELYSDTLPSGFITTTSETSSNSSDSDDIDCLISAQQTGPGFPASLKSLELVDNTEKSSSQNSLEAEWSFLCEGVQQPLALLTSLYLDMKYASVTAGILQKIAPMNLNHLAVSSFTRQVIYNEIPTLQHIVILNAWKHSALSFCNAFCHLLQVYLAEPPPKQRDEFKRADYLQSIWEKNLSTRIFGHDPQPARWGRDVRHLRVDQIDPKTLRVDSIDSNNQGLKKLRVIVLRPPRVITDGPWIWNLETERYPKEPFGPPIPDSDAMLQLPEYILASHLAAQDLPELRLIAVGKYRFWVQRSQSSRRKKQKTKSKSKSKSKLWFLRHALEDPTEETKLLEWATKRDWEFLVDKEIRLTEEAAVEAKRRASRVVLFKEVEGWGRVSEVDDDIGITR